MIKTRKTGKLFSQARGAVVGLLLAFVWVGMTGPMFAADEDKPHVWVGYSPREPGTELTSGADLPLRPNITQPVYLHLVNPADSAVTAVVRLVQGPRGGPVVVLASSAPLPLEAAPPKKAAVPHLVTGWKLDVQTPVVSPASAVPPPPTALDLGDGTIRVQVILDKGTPAVDELTQTRVREPREYVQPELHYFSREDGRENLLSVRVRTIKEAFTGPPCPVSLDLSPQRIPGLIPVRTGGVFKQVLTGAGDGQEVELLAENLRFEKKNALPHGQVTLSVDGCERAFVFDVDFAAGTPQGLTVKSNPETALHLVADRYVLPGDRLRIGLLVDNPPQEQVKLRVSMAEVLRNSFVNESRERKGVLLSEMSSPREERVRLLPPASDGALMFQTEVKPWAIPLNAAALSGTFHLVARMTAKSGKHWESERDITFDSTPPVNVSFLKEALPRKLVRGQPLVLEAAGEDPESPITRVLFFVGKPLPDNKVPPDAPQVLGELTKAGTWAAKLPVPTDAKATIPVSVQFTNAVGLNATDTIVIQLVDPPAASKVSSIEGVVYEGDRPQPNLPVFLRDSSGSARDTVRTDAEGRYHFKEVAPGAYRVSASKPTGSRGETAVQILEGQKKVDINVKLTR